MVSIARKTLATGLAALTVGLCVATTSTPASAQWGWGFGAGLLTGAAVGVLATRPYYYPPYAYGPGPAYYPGCGWRRQPAYDPYGNFVGYRSVRVCY